MCHCNSHVDFVTNGVAVDCFRIQSTHTVKEARKLRGRPSDLETFR